MTINDTSPITILSASAEINKYIDTLPTKHKFLKDYQYLILQYFLSPHFENKQLLLLWLAVGRGKTLLSIACAIAGLDKGMFKQVIILCPKSIIDEFHKNMKLYFNLLYPNSPKSSVQYNKYINKFHLIAYNSWKAYTNLLKIPNLNHTLFIIDEAHLFMKSIIKVNLRDVDTTNKKYKYIGNAKRIYDKIQSISRKKVLVLTGTPSAKTPFETIPIFNLAYKQPLFDCDYNKFNDKYIDFDRNQIVHVDELIRKLDGLIAYVPAVSNVTKASGNPRATELKLINVEMSEKQYKQYLIDYEKEVNESSFTNKRNVFGLMFGSVSTFHTKTFEDCIYYNDKLTNRDYEDRYVGKITIDNIHCPKIVKMYNDSCKINGSCVFYFRFARMYGIECMEMMLQTKNFIKVDSDNVDNVFKSKGKRYVVFSGSESNTFRDECKGLFNDKRNRYGEYIKYMLLSPSGSVGITLKNVRYLGIGSVSFNYSEIRQIMGRVNRLKSHEDLPFEDRTVENKIYVMTKNVNYYNKHKKFIDNLCSRKAPGCDEIAPSIEKIILYDSYEDDKINESFKNDVLIHASITEKVYDKF